MIQGGPDASYCWSMFLASCFVGRPLRRAEWYSSDLMHPLFSAFFFELFVCVCVGGRPMHRAEWHWSDLMHPIFGTCFL